MSDMFELDDDVIIEDEEVIVDSELTEEINEIATGEKKPEPEPAPEPAKPAPKPVNILETDPYEWDQCQVTIGIALLPVGQGQTGENRTVVIGVRTHYDEPILRFTTLDKLSLDPAIQELLDEMQAVLPERGERKTKEEAEAKAKAEKAKADASKTAEQRKAEREAQKKAEKEKKEQEKKEQQKKEKAEKMGVEFEPASLFDFSDF